MCFCASPKVKRGCEGRRGPGEDGGPSLCSFSKGSLVAYLPFLGCERGCCAIENAPTAISLVAIGYFVVAVKRLAILAREEVLSAVGRIPV
jgi:hypothetical protein